MNSFVGQMNMLLIICSISIVLNVAKDLCKSMTASSILITISLHMLYYYLFFDPAM